ncbi:MAG: 4Fe-4S dicluster domain-containing protein [Deltaproteobacteria bacterium]|nr:4Fe-4S dicluster domain-containing protein [Deltaproteobacteria bacterium]
MICQQNHLFRYFSARPGFEQDPKVRKAPLIRYARFIFRFNSVCAHCSLCAESCFLFNAFNKDPKYMPSYKFIHSIGILYKKKGKVDRSMLEEISINIWKRCVLCTRCYCPFGIDIPSMIALARSICRSQGVFPRYD